MDGQRQPQPPRDHLGIFKEGKGLSLRLSVTRTFFEILDFFSENVEKIVKKCQNCVEKRRFM